MLTRRELLSSLAVAPLAAEIPVLKKLVAPGTEIWHEQHCLSQESASGFRRLLNKEQSVVGRIRRGREKPSVILVPGVRQLSEARCEELLRRVQVGTWLILETGVCFSSAEQSKQQASLLKSAFDLEVLSPAPVAASRKSQTAYIAFVWPLRSLTRTFEAVTPIRCERSEAIAFFDNQPVGAKRSLGKGGIIYLGTMLGPGLFAEEREAHALGRALLRSLWQSD
jgi:hypothetical protein